MSKFDDPVTETIASDPTDVTQPLCPVFKLGEPAARKIVCEVCGHVNKGDSLICEMCSNYLFD